METTIIKENSKSPSKGLHNHLYIYINGYFQKIFEEWSETYLWFSIVLFHLSPMAHANLVAFHKYYMCNRR